MGNILLESPRLNLTLPAGAEDRHQDRIHTCGPRRSGIFPGRRASASRTRARARCWSRPRAGARRHRSHHRHSHRDTDSGRANSPQPAGSATASFGPGTGCHTRGRSGCSPESGDANRSDTAGGSTASWCGFTRRRPRACRARVCCHIGGCGATRCTTDNDRTLGGSRTSAACCGGRPGRSAPRWRKPVDSRFGRTGACVCGDADAAHRKSFGSCSENAGI